jgi:hypothetical protein
VKSKEIEPQRHRDAEVKRRLSFCRENSGERIDSEIYFYFLFLCVSASLWFNFFFRLANGTSSRHFLASRSPVAAGAGLGGMAGDDSGTVEPY